MAQPLQVLIVGAGPTGLMLALQLARRGVRLRIIDRNDGPSPESRAAVVHARTLEFLQQLGLANAAIEQGRALARLQVRQRGRVRADLPLSGVGRGESQFPFVLALGQNETEALLLRELERKGVPVERGREAISVHESDDSVRVGVGGHGLSRSEEARSSLAQAAPELIETRWLCACDGAASGIRRSLGVPFEGGSYEHRFYLADCRVDGSLPEDGVTICPEHRGLAVFFGMAGERRFRVIGKLPDEQADLDALSFEQMAELAVRVSGLPLRLSSPRWSSVYRLHHRAVPHLRVGRSGRVLLLGDAAHVHSPVGGQGMNTGIQDAVNLAWKLALVSRGAAHESLLETFQEERLPVIQTLLRTTDRLFTLATSEHAIIAALRGWLLGPLLGLVLHRPSLRRRAFAALSQTAISYRSGSIAGVAQAAGSTRLGTAHPGDRMPFLEVPMGDGPPRGLIDFCRSPWFTALVIGGTRGEFERAAHGSRRRADAAPLEDLLTWLHLPRLQRGGVPLQGPPTPQLIIVRPDLHCFGCWPLERSSEAIEALGRMLAGAR